MKFQPFENLTDHIVICYSSEYKVQFEIQFLEIQFSEQLDSRIENQIRNLYS